MVQTQTSQQLLRVGGAGAVIKGVVTNVGVVTGAVGAGQNCSKSQCYVAHGGILVAVARVTAVAYGNEFAKGTGNFY